ncbi:glycerol-3-phosphate dehydrogenase/oxidase [Campylobacter sp. MIT 21-1685]|uniref:glycerol-3-phosphate dehydrogenase/oxidase n=1 Tax=unclassified Campylobacter TaxID=2593542 RepID=UPI00224B9DCE|nr:MULTISPECIES: glycerol-3-phosphate dehydrogenase/oxidase [unclassified Campylobacter]MCX2683037.1 glycerol-3-phosphate dehydrogenase/oxidase [Campylobacter sp. MIT 21-1684]MCX2751319.1 glycerol-3-phosphate dehydrogenase/oxidase [Campylobacter sp. MIT 21-1682]MCX2807518.1 glycerol-3-phosphate dehydrogenase/oxidase [Campylobacter sp. MIT 21-1685]
MKRDEGFLRLKENNNFDVIIIGGGATGSALAFDSASRGYKTLLLEAYDFAKGTSSRSTKLLHGGVRYLAQANFSLVREALRERNRFFNNAPHLCKQQNFIIPNEGITEALYYYLGLKLYDMLAGKFNFKKTSFLNKIELNAKLLGLDRTKFNYGISYTDGRFDDARMALSLIQSAYEYKALVLNYSLVTNLLKDEQGYIKGLIFEDLIHQQEFEVYSKCVINATGVFASNILKMDKSSNDLVLSQGVHIVLDKEFFPNEYALMIPKTEDGRVLFIIPWYDKLLLGTTDTEVKKLSYEPKAFEEEIDFILNEAYKMLVKKPQRSDIKSVFVGLRPLIKSSAKESKKLSRSHKIELHSSRLIDISGGKYTTIRAMAEQCIQKAIKWGLLESKVCKTKNLKLIFYDEKMQFDERLSVYGTQATKIKELEKTKLAKKIHPEYPYTYAQVFHALEEEMAQNVEDILARRIRLLFIDAKACIECAKEVNDFVAQYFKWDKQRTDRALAEFLSLARKYQI